MKTCCVAVGMVLLSMMSQFTRAAEAGPVEYKIGDQVFEGFILPAPRGGKAPGVLLVPDWMGNTEYSRHKAKQIAEMGYAVFVADMYGKGVRPSSAKEAGALAGQIKADRALMRQRAQAALAAMCGQPSVDPQRVAAIGYCFGGTTVLELARSGADVAGVISFHGGLDTPNAADARNIRCKVLALHGADDPFVPAKDVAAFEEEMRKAKVDWQLVAYGNAVHSFTRPDAGNDPSKGAAYNEAADRRSWTAMKSFFAELFTVK